MFDIFPFSAGVTVSLLKIFSNSSIDIYIAQVSTGSCHKKEFTWRHDMDTKEIAACMGKMMTMMMTMIMATNIIFTMIMIISMTWTPRRLLPAWVR